METFKTVSIREKNYEFVDNFAYINNISKAEAINRIVEYYINNEIKKDVKKTNK